MKNVLLITLVAAWLIIAFLAGDDYGFRRRRKIDAGRIAYSSWQPYSEESIGIGNRKDCESAPHNPFMVPGAINQWRDGRCGYIFPLELRYCAGDLAHHAYPPCVAPSSMVDAKH